MTHSPKTCPNFESHSYQIIKQSAINYKANNAFVVPNALFRHLEQLTQAHVFPTPPVHLGIALAFDGLRIAFWLYFGSILVFIIYEWLLNFLASKSDKTTPGNNA